MTAATTTRTPEPGRPPRRSLQPRSTPLWSVAKALLVLAVLALGMAGLRFFRAVENPGVEECGPPAPYVISGQEPVQLDLDAMPLEEYQRLDAQPSCRDLAWEQFEAGLLALGVGIALGLTGAVLGLVDDRVKLSRAPRFESLLRKRPGDAPVKLTAGLAGRDLDAGRPLPAVDVIDLGHLVLGFLVTFTLLRATAGAEALGGAVGEVTWALIPALVGCAVVPHLLAGMQLSAAARGRLGVPAATEVEVASAYRGEASPLLGPFGLAAHVLGRKGVPRPTAVDELTGLALVSGLAHLTLVALVVPASGILGGLTDAPERWWFLIGLVVASVVVGLLRGLAPTGRLLRVPGWPALGRLADLAREAPAELGRLVAASFALPLANAVVLWLAVASVGGGVGFAVAAAASLTAAAAGASGPTPGGVGMVDAVLVWLLVGAGMGPAEAVLAVMAFRFVGYWAPLAVGAVVARRVEARA